MRENNRNSIEKSRKKLPQFTTMNVIDGQAGLEKYSSLIFYSLTIDNILNIIVLLILAGVSIAMLTGDNGIITQAQRAKDETDKASSIEAVQVEALGAIGSDGKIDVDSLISNIGKNLKDAEATGLGNEVVVEYNGYKYLVEEDGNVIYWEGGETQANAPKLATGMIPIKYNEETGNWVICSEDDEEWYSYTTEDKKWANVMLCDGTYDESTAIGTEVEEEDLGSMFVWIPRYAYKITEGYHSSSGKLDVKFVAGAGYAYSDAEGNITQVKKGNEEGVITDTGYTDYVVHPAFTDGNKYGYDNGEWKQEIEGIWVAKFDAGFATTDGDVKQKVSNSTTANNLYYPIFKGRKFGYNYVTASQCYDLSLSLDDSGNPYGLNSLSNSHLMKSSEWGATAYLSISQYGYSDGTSSKEKAKNNVRISSTVQNPNNTSWAITAITGYSATGGKSPENSISYSSTSDLDDVVTGTNSQTSYAWNNCDNGDEGNGTKSSTTGNIYGVYDMGGGLAEYTAAYVNSGSTNLSYGKSFVTGVSDHLSTAYPYNPSSSSTDYKDFNSGYNGTGWNEIFGDAIWETSAGTGTGKAWFGQTLEEDGPGEEPFFPRGGTWGDTGIRFVWLG